MVNHIVVEFALTGLIQLSLYELFHVINLVQTLLEFSLAVWVIAEDGRVLLNYLLFILIHFIVESLKLCSDKFEVSNSLLANKNICRAQRLFLKPKAQ